jgi:hypothetical protein
MKEKKSSGKQKLPTIPNSTGQWLGNPDSWVCWKYQTCLPKEVLIQYSKVQKCLPFSSQEKNLFVDLVEKVASELNVSQCCVCRGAFGNEQV